MYQTIPMCFPWVSPKRYLEFFMTKIFCDRLISVKITKYNQYYLIKIYLAVYALKILFSRWFFPPCILFLLKKVWVFFLENQDRLLLDLSESVATQLVRQYTTILVSITVLSRRLTKILLQWKFDTSKMCQFLAYHCRFIQVAKFRFKLRRTWLPLVMSLPVDDNNYFLPSMIELKIWVPTASFYRE